MFCSKCGKENMGSAHFCGSCGNAISISQSPSAMTQMATATVTSDIQPVVQKKVGTGLLVAGYIFAFLGGLIGIAIGSYIKFGKIKDTSGNKTPKFDESSRDHGKYILIISVIAGVLWRIIIKSMA